MNTTRQVRWLSIDGVGVSLQWIWFFNYWVNTWRDLQSVGLSKLVQKQGGKLERGSWKFESKKSMMEKLVRDDLNNGEEIFADFKHCQEKANEIHKRGWRFSWRWKPCKHQVYFHWCVSEYQVNCIDWVGKLGR